VIIIGAGASGLMCAIYALKRNLSVLILEKSEKIAKKILISGGGRCNFTNLNINSEAYISSNPHFHKSALSQYTQWDFMDLMQQHNLTWHEKKLGQLFCNEKAPAIVKMLFRECENADIKINCEVLDIQLGFSIKTNQGEFKSKSLVIATGGASIPKMGATDFAIKIAQKFALKTKNFQAGLVPFVFKNHCFKDLSGTSFEVIVSCNNVSFRENMLITHRGLSGPAILQISSYWQKNQEIIINLLPDINAQTWLLEQQNINPKKLLKSILTQFFSKKMSSKLVDVLSDFEEKTLNEIKIKDLKIFARKLNNFSIIPDTIEGMRTAEVCLGGVDTSELSSKTMETHKIKNLFFVGEAVDVTGHLGGYNFQWAWSSGFVVGNNILK